VAALGGGGSNPYSYCAGLLDGLRTLPPGEDLCSALQSLAGALPPRERLEGLVFGVIRDGMMWYFRAGSAGASALGPEGASAWEEPARESASSSRTPLAEGAMIMAWAGGMPRQPASDQPPSEPGEALGMLEDDGRSPVLVIQPASHAVPAPGRPRRRVSARLLPVAGVLALAAMACFAFFDSGGGGGDEGEMCLLVAGGSDRLPVARSGSAVPVGGSPEEGLYRVGGGGGAVDLERIVIARDSSGEGMEEVRTYLKDLGMFEKAATAVVNETGSRLDGLGVFPSDYALFLEGTVPRYGRSLVVEDDVRDLQGRQVHQAEAAYDAILIGTSGPGPATPRRRP